MACDYADNGATSRYSAMQVQAQPRFGKGLLFSSTWSWAKYLGDTGDFEPNTTMLCLLAWLVHIDRPLTGAGRIGAAAFALALS
jgi:hypothetical protein